MSEIFREVDEEVRKDRVLELWKRYGRFVIGGAVGVVVATAAWQGWSAWSFADRQADAARYLGGLELADAGRWDAAEAVFAALAADSSAGYRDLAQLQRASALIASGDVDAGVRIYDEFATGAGSDPAFRDLATVLAALALLDTADQGEIDGRLAPLLDGSGPWRFSALELAGLAALRHGDEAVARTLFARLTDDAETPQAMRARAAELLSALGGA